MQLINAPAKLVLPFANAGAKNTIPTASQIGIVAGAASLTDGFPPLTRTPLAAGGVPPSGLDMNGVLFELSAILRWANAGGGYPYDSSFANDANVGGYPKGSRVMRSDGLGYWFNTADNNVTDPEGAGAVVAGWVPDYTTGSTAVTMTNANVTLTALQYGKPIIIITGLLTANLNLIFPNIVGEWTVVNNTTGAFTITAKTAAGTGVPVTQSAATLVYGDATNIGSLSAGLTQAAADARYVQIANAYKNLPTVGATVASNALTVTIGAEVLDFRSATLTSGAPVTRTAATQGSLTVPTGASLGMVNGQQSRIVWGWLDNAGTLEPFIGNLSGGVNLSETTLISTTAISAGATAANVLYSTIARSNVAFRIRGMCDITEAAAGTWATAPTLVQAIGGQALAAMSSLGYGQTVQDLTGSRTIGTTYYNTTGRPIYVSVHLTVQGASNGSLTINGAIIAYAATTTGVAGQLTVSGIVPPGGNYVVTQVSGTVSVTHWTEIR